MLTKQDGFLEHAEQDILLAFDEDSRRAWIGYRDLVDRLTGEVEGGDFAKVSSKDVGILHRAVHALHLESSLPLEFESVLRRLGFDKDFHGHAMVGMSDLIAIRSVEQALQVQIANSVYARLGEKSLLVMMLKDLRVLDESRSIVDDLKIVTTMARRCLAVVTGIAVSTNGVVKTGDLKLLHDKNALDRFPHPDDPNAFANFVATLLLEGEERP